MPINQTEYFVEEKTAEEECLTEMPNVSALSPAVDVETIVE